MRVIGAKRGLGLDTVTNTIPFLGLFRTLGIRTVFRYLNYHKEYRSTPCTDPRDWFKSLSTLELERDLEAGFDVGIFQRGIGGRNSGGWESGVEAGEAAVYNARGVGVPDGATILIDCEWSDPPPKDRQRSHIEGRARAIVDGGYLAALYVSHDLALTSAELYSLRWVTGYLKSASAVPTVDVRGYQAAQSLECWITTDAHGWPCVLPWDDKYYRYPRPGIRADLDMVMIDGLRDRYQVIAL
jgi:hypothetical protein